MTNEFPEGERSPIELPDPPHEGRAVIPPPPGRAFGAPREDSSPEAPTDKAPEGDSARNGNREPSRNGNTGNRRRRRGGRGLTRNRSDDRQGYGRSDSRSDGRSDSRSDGRSDGRSRGRSGSRRTSDSDAGRDDSEAGLIARRRGKERDGRPLGRYLMCVHVRNDLTQVALLEGRSLIEHYVSRPADDVAQIHGSIYLGKVQNVLPGMEAAFVDIGTPKNAVLYRGDVQFDKEDVVEQGPEPRIEHVLKRGQLILCQVTKNPIGEKGARLTQEVSLPGRFVVLIPDSKTYGISKRLPEGERRRLRNVLDRIKPEQHGLIVRTAAENATEHELETDMKQLVERWAQIKSKAEKASSPTLLYREPSLAVLVIRE